MHEDESLRRLSVRDAGIRPLDPFALRLKVSPVHAAKNVAKAGLYKLAQLFGS